MKTTRFSLIMALYNLISVSFDNKLHAQMLYKLLAGRINGQK